MRTCSLPANHKLDRSTNPALLHSHRNRYRYRYTASHVIHNGVTFACKGSDVVAVPVLLFGFFMPYSVSTSMPHVLRNLTTKSLVEVAGLNCDVYNNSGCINCVENLEMPRTLTLLCIWSLMIFDLVTAMPNVCIQCSSCSDVLTLKQTPGLDIALFSPAIVGWAAAVSACGRGCLRIILFCTYRRRQPQHKRVKWHFPVPAAALCHPHQTAPAWELVGLPV